MFPKKKIDMRRGLTKYQTEKINKEMRALENLAGGKNYLLNDFAPATRTKAMREYQKNVGLSKHARGVLIGGGSKLKSRVTIKGGALHYIAGERAQFQIPLDATTEKTLSRDIRKNKKIINRADSFSYIGTHGGKIHNLGVSEELEGEEAAELLESLALEIYNKYLKMTEQNKIRENGRYAAHPSKWGMVLISEPSK